MGVSIDRCIRAERVIWRKLDEVPYLCKLIRYSLQISVSFSQLLTARRQLLPLNGQDKERRQRMILQSVR